MRPRLQRVMVPRCQVMVVNNLMDQLAQRMHGKWFAAQRANKTRIEVLPAGYNFPVPDMPEAATLLPFRIVRLVEFVVADGGKHFIHNLVLNMCNHSWVFFGQGDTGEWRPGNWTWQKKESEVLTLTYAWKNGIPLKTTSLKRNVVGWHVTAEHSRASDCKVLYLLHAAEMLCGFHMVKFCKDVIKTVVRCVPLIDITRFALPRIETSNKPSHVCTFEPS